MDIIELKEKMRQTERQIEECIKAMEDNDVKYLSLDIEVIDATTKMGKSYFVRAKIRSQIDTD